MGRLSVADGLEVGRLEDRKFKDTEVGRIPVDWEVKRLGDVIEYTKGYPFKSKDYCNEGTRIIRVSDTTYDSIKEENPVYINEKKAKKFSKWLLKENDLIVSTVGSKPPMYDSLVGKCVIVRKEHEGSLLNQNAVLIRTKTKNISTHKILYYNLKTKRYLNYIENIFRGNANQASINLSDIFKFFIPLPPLEEQKAIAKVLSDVDKLIKSIEKLIHKKNQIKQGTMQELLTGKKRLPGFNGEWEVRKLGEVFDITAGGDLKKDLYSETKDDIHIYPIYSNSLTNKGLYGYSSVYDYTEDAITITARGTIGYAIYRDHKFCAIGRVLVLKPKVRVNNFFISQYINSNLKFTIENTGVPQLTAPKISIYKIPLPPLKEQKAIAEILSDMDSEIESLEKKLEKYKLIKEGIMEKLLTGQVRLI